MFARGLLFAPTSTNTTLLFFFTSWRLATQPKPADVSEKPRESPGVPVVDKDKQPPLPVKPLKKPLAERVKDELLHYWHGTKLLGVEIIISAKLVYKILKGKSLTRREYKQVSLPAMDVLFFTFFFHLTGGLPDLRWIWLMRDAASCKGRHRIYFVSFRLWCLSSCRLWSCFFPSP